MKKAFRNLAFLGAALLLAGAYAFADDGKAAVQDATEPLVVTMEAFRVETGEDGKENLIATEKVEPGQTVEYILISENVAEVPITRISLLGPIPGNTQYLAKSATQKGKLVPVFSIDQGQTFKHEPVTYTVKLPDGSEVEKVATEDMYTHIRWTISELDVGEIQKLHYRVLVK